MEGYSLNQKFESDAVQNFIKFRGIQPEHFVIVQELLNIPKEYIHPLHNFFQLNKDMSARALRRHIDTNEDPVVKNVYTLLLTITEAYDWTTAWNMIVVLEKSE
jgi:sulfur transfer complex TusBCD TusB component (DsrH family)